MKNKEEELRFIKTEKIIEKSFFDLKKEGDKNIKVSTLCKKAIINKSTFYDHYENIDELRRSLCKKAVYSILDNCKYIKCLFSDTKNFVKSIIDEFEKNMANLWLLFEGDESFVIKIIEEYLFNVYLKEKNPNDTKLKIVFVIGGSARLLIRKRSENITNIITKLIENVIKDTTYLS